MRRPRAMALVTTLLMAGILLMLVVSLILSVRSEKFMTLEYSNKVAGNYVAEAGVTAVLAHLKADPAWETDEIDQALVGGAGTYTVDFNPTKTGVTSTQSVNNLAGTSSVDGPRGPLTVPPRTADVVVTSRYNGVTRRMEVLIGRGGLQLTSALTSSGRIKLVGDVTVKGVKSLSTYPPVPVAAGIHSNNEAGASGTIVSWEAGAGEHATVSGTVSASGASSAVDFTSNAIETPHLNGAPPTRANAPAQSYPSINIAQEIANNASHPAPTLGAGTTTLSSNKFTHNGDLTINGDLVLKTGAALYVTGKLTVNGSIAGDGSVYVGGTTDFQGDAYFDNQTSASIFSRGTVHLTGFDGKAFIDSAASTNPVLAEAWQDIQDTLPAQQAYFANSEWDPAKLTRLRRVLGYSDQADTWNGNLNDATGYLINELNGMGPSAQRDLLVKKFEGLREMNSWHGSVGNKAHTPAANPSLDTVQPYNYPSASAAWNDFLSTGSLRAIVQAGISGGGSIHDIARAYKIVAQRTASFDVDHPGNSFFKGLVYTNGAFYAENHVEVVGGLVARSDGSQPVATFGTLTLNPGDLLLQKGSRITYVEDMFDGSTGGVAGPLGVMTSLGD